MSVFFPTRQGIALDVVLASSAASSLGFGLWFAVVPKRRLSDERRLNSLLGWLFLYKLHSQFDFLNPGQALVNQFVEHLNPSSVLRKGCEIWPGHQSFCLLHDQWAVHQEERLLRDSGFVAFPRR